MATPTLVTVTGRITRGGDPAAGTVTFTTYRPLVSAADDSVVVPAPSTVVVLDGDGEFTVQLLATNDPDWLPVGWSYSVRVNAGAGARGSMQLDYQATSVDFDDVFQAGGSAEAGRSFVKVSALGQPSGVATLDEDGILVESQWPPVDDAVDSVNGLTGTVVLEPADIGIYTGSSEPVGAADGDIWFDTSGA